MQVHSKDTTNQIIINTNSSKSVVTEIGLLNIITKYVRFFLTSSKTFRKKFKRCGNYREALISMYNITRNEMC